MEENAVLPYKLIRSLLTMGHFQLSWHAKTTACITNGSAKGEYEEDGACYHLRCLGVCKTAEYQERPWPLNFLSPQRHIIVLKSNCFLFSIKHNVGYILAPSITLCREITRAGQWHTVVLLAKLITISHWAVARLCLANETLSHSWYF